MEISHEGCVDRIIWENSTQDSYIFILKIDDDTSIKVVGNFPQLKKGEFLKITGIKESNKKYGDQIKCASWEKILPKSTEGIEKFLGSGLIKGIGPKTAQNINAYKKQNGNFNTVDDLLNVKGIGEKSLKKMKPYVTI